MRSRRWLKGFHVLFSSAWVGAGVSIAIIPLVSGNPIDGGTLYGYNASILLVDNFIIIPSAMGCLITGLLISWLTPWGFFKYWSVIVPGVIAVAAIVSGIVWLGPWVNDLAAISKAQGLRALQNEEYLQTWQMVTIFGTIQAIALVLMVFVSIVKPWGRTMKTEDAVAENAIP